MQIAVNMVFDSAREFAEWANTVGLISEAGAVSDTPKPAMETTKDTPKAPPKVRRKRRTKQQIEDDSAADAHANAVTSEASKDLGIVDSITPQPDPPAAREYTLEDALPILRAYLAVNDSAAMIAKLREYGATRVTEVDPTRVSAFLTELVDATP